MSDPHTSTDSSNNNTNDSFVTKTKSLFSHFFQGDFYKQFTVTAGLGVFALTAYKIYSHWNVPRVSHLFVYPVKGCKGVSMDEAQLTDTGLEYDRRWMIVKVPQGSSSNDVNKFMTQRQVPQMATLKTELLSRSSDEKDGKDLMLWYVDQNGERQECLVEKRNTDERRRVQVWNDVVDAIDEGDTVAQFVTRFFAQYTKDNATYRLVRAEQKSRSCAKKFSDQLHSDMKPNMDFADGFPYLLVSQQSVDDFNSKVKHANIECDRFRPNIVVTGKLEPYDEDWWNTIRIHGALFKNCKTCTRCTVPSINQNTGERDLKIAAALKEHRSGVMDGNDTTLFGVNLCGTVSDTKLQVGDLVRVLDRKEKRDYEPSE